MPAKHLHRIDEDGVYSHIYNRAVENRILFNDEEDFRTFLNYLGDYLSPKNTESNKKTFQIKGQSFQGTPHLPKNYFNKIELIAYNLMPDHFHLVLYQISKGSLERFVRSLCTRYSIYYNKKYNRTGSLFIGPYKSAPVDIGLRLSHLSRYLHINGTHSSYPEYLGSRKTEWIKPAAVLSLFDNNQNTYKDFVEKHQPDETLLLEKTTLDTKLDHIKKENSTYSQKEDSTLSLEMHSNLPNFLAISTAFFLLLVTLGIGNIKLSDFNKQPIPSPVVLAETIELQPQIAPENTPLPVPETLTEPKTMLIIKIEDPTIFINIRQEPTADSPKIAKASQGEVFEIISEEPDWYEIKLPDEQSGFISKQYAEKIEEQQIND